MQRRRLMSALVLVVAVVGAIVAGCSATAEAAPDLQINTNLNRGW